MYSIRAPLLIKAIICFNRSPIADSSNQTRTQFVNHLLLEGPGHGLPSNTTTGMPNDTLTTPITYKPSLLLINKIPNSFLHKSAQAVVSHPSPFTLSKHLTTTPIPLSFHYITKSSKSTPIVSTTVANVGEIFDSVALTSNVIKPTTYAPPKFFLKSLLPKPLSTTILEAVIKTRILNNQSKPEVRKPYKTVKTIRKILNSATINNELSRSLNTSVPDENAVLSSTELAQSTESGNLFLSPPSSEESVRIGTETSSENWHYVSKKGHKFRATVEVPDISELVADLEDTSKAEPDQPPAYKVKPPLIPNPSNKTRTTTPAYPSRVSRVNTAIKSLIAIGGPRRQNAKCSDVNCNEINQRYLFCMNTTSILKSICTSSD